LFAETASTKTCSAAEAREFQIEYDYYYRHRFQGLASILSKIDGYSETSACAFIGRFGKKCVPHCPKRLHDVIAVKLTTDINMWKGFLRCVSKAYPVREKNQQLQLGNRFAD